MNNVCAVVLLSMLAAWPLGADELLRASRSWDGGAIAYPEGAPEVTSSILRIEEGFDTAFHCHPVPTMGYVLSGTVLVETADGSAQRFAAGSSVLEVMNTLHRGRALNGPAEIVVFYAGARGVPNTVLPESGGDCER